MFGWKKRATSAPKSFDRAVFEPCIRASICTGERSVGFRRLDNGKFEEYAVIRSDEDLAAFLREYGLSREDLKKIY